MLSPKQCLLILVVLTFGVYSPSLVNGFAYDDMDIVRVPSVSGFPNHMVAEVQPIGDYYSGYYGESVAGLGRGYRPTTVLSWALVHAVTKRPAESVPPDAARASAGPQHFVNILLHCFAVWLTFRMLSLLAGGGFGPVLGAAVFGLHALRSDPVLSLVGRGEILGYLFGVLGLLGYVAALRRSGGGRYCYLAGTGLALFLAFTSKESAAPWVVFLPLFVLAMAWLGRDGAPTPMQQLLPWLVGVLTPFLVFLGLYLSVTSDLGDFSPAYESNPLWYLPDQRFGTGVMLMGYAIYKLLVPFSLACDYGAEVFTMVESLADSRFLLAFALLLGLLAFGLLRATRHPLLFLATAAFFGFSLLVSNIPFPIETIFAERLYYTPTLACSFLVAWLAGRLGGTRLQTSGVWSLGLWCAVCSLVILKRDFNWRDNASLFAADVVSQPRSISMLLSQRDMLEFQHPGQWKQVLDKAYALSPTSPFVL
ncbi:MAG: hypothetical protein VX951_00975, partial [Planctomycetota bacterium]|nr:hypothetical protein [Planctomycetota bacterium]